MKGPIQNLKIPQPFAMIFVYKFDKTGNIKVFSAYSLEKADFDLN